MAKQAASLSFIVARARNCAIGCENRLPWRLPSDLRKFKELTWGRPVIMGRRTFESLGRALPGRPNIVVSRENGIHGQNVIVVNDKRDAIKRAQEEADRLGATEIMVIGGAEIFELFEAEVSKVYLTEVDTVISNADAFFRRDFSDWRVSSRETVSGRPGDEFSYSLTVYEKPTARGVQVASTSKAMNAARELCYA